jgi:hypothetical protein
MSGRAEICWKRVSMACRVATIASGVGSKAGRLSPYAVEIVCDARKGATQSDALKMRAA